MIGAPQRKTACLQKSNRAKQPDEGGWTWFMDSHRDKIGEYLLRAQALRAVAQSMKGEEARQLLLEIADDYEQRGKALESLGQFSEIDAD